MPLFRYIAVDADDEWQRGEESAADGLSLRRSLEEKGWKVTKIEEIQDVETVVEGKVPVTRLSTTESAVLAQRVADVARLGLPLEAGLRAVADEAPTRRLRRVLTQLSEDMEKGESLEAALVGRKRQVPGHLLQLVQAGLETRTLALVLERYVQSVRRGSQLRGRLVLGLAYPAVVGLGSLLLLLATLLWIMPQFDSIFGDFGVELPSVTVFVVHASRVVRAFWGWLLLTVGLLGIATVFGVMMLLRSRAGRRVLCAIPVIGPMLRLTALAEFAHLLGQFLEARTELPKALELAGEGSGDAVIAWGARGLAMEVRHGVPLADAATMARDVPLPMRQMLRWSNNPHRFSEALFSAAEMCLARASVQATIIGPFLEPFALFTAGAVFGMVILAILLPLFKLLNDLA